MILLSVAIGIVTLVLLLPTLSDLVSLLHLLRGRTATRPTRHAPPPRLLFLVPAHNEELLLPACLRSLRAINDPSGACSVLVIADNCTDRTAQVAREAGVEVLERTDPQLLGKPRALAWAIDRIDLDAHDAVVIVDADTMVDSGFARAISERAPVRSMALQPFNDVLNRQENALTRMAAVYGRAVHLGAFGLKHRAGLNVPLSAGMCLGADLLQRYGWPAFSICEDWELYTILTLDGLKIEPVSGARIYAQEARSLDQSASQRRRWMAGKFAVLGRYAGALARQRGVSIRQRLDCYAELTHVGPAVHLGVAGILLAGIALLQPPGALWIAIGLMVTLARVGAYTAASVVRDPEPLKVLTAFLFLPVYTLWRLGTALASLELLRGGPWVRTQRHEGTAASTDEASRRP